MRKIERVIADGVELVENAQLDDMMAAKFRAVSNPYKDYILYYDGEVKKAIYAGDPIGRTRNVYIGTVPVGFARILAAMAFPKVVEFTFYEERPRHSRGYWHETRRDNSE